MKGIMQKVAQSTLARRKRVLLTALLIGALCNQVLAAEHWAGMEAYDRGDYGAALRELRPLAEHGRPAAQMLLGDMYRFGKGVPENRAEAV